MECSTAKSNIEATADIVREASFKEKNNLSNEELTNELLDKILEFKKVLKKKISQIEKVITQLEEFTWYEFEKLDKSIIQNLNDVILSSRDWSESLHRNRLKCLDKLGDKVTISELSDLKDSIDDLSEAANTLEKAIFFYPKDSDFKRITKELADL